MSNKSIFNTLSEICQLGVTVSICTGIPGSNSLEITLRTDGEDPIQAKLVVEDTILNNVTSPNAADITIVGALYSNAQEMHKIIKTKRGY